MSNPYFRFKQFTVWHDRCAMKVGTDGVLLGAWATASVCRSILDVGTGTGLIALMLAQRCRMATIDAIEIDPDACAQAAENVSASPFAQQIRIHHASFQEFTKKTHQLFDLIVANPPYFVQSLKCPEVKRRIARHNDALSPAVLLAGSSRLLTPNGRISLIFNFLNHKEVLQQAVQNNLCCLRRTEIIPVEGAQPKRILMEFALIQQHPVQRDTLTLTNAKHRRTEAYQALASDFYLDQQDGLCE